MLRSSPALQHALQRIATVAQLRWGLGGWQRSLVLGRGMRRGRHPLAFHPHKQPVHTTWRTPHSPLVTPCCRSLLAPRDPADRPLCVANTHLFFHYMAPHIRTMHVWAIMQARGGQSLLSLGVAQGLLRRGAVAAPAAVQRA